MEKSKAIKLTFSCTQDWNAMPPTEKGRFCDHCKHEVIDFSNVSLAKIREMKAQNPNLCGNFRREQIETHLNPVEFKVVKKSKYLAAAIATFFGIEISSLKAQEKPEIRTEQHTDYRIIRKPTGEVCQKVEKEQEAVVKTHYRSRVILRTDNYIYYWSRYFPYIKKRSRYMKGMFR